MATPDPALKFHIDESPNGIRYFIDGKLVCQVEFEDRRQYECDHRTDIRNLGCHFCGLGLPAYPGVKVRAVMPKDIFRIMMDGSSSPRQQEEIQKQVCRLKDLLRQAVATHTNAVVSDRRTYKTTALIEYVAERLLILSPPARVAVICPDYNIARHFDDRYRMAFPNVRCPIVTNIDEVLRHGTLDGSGTTEVYAEEMFAIPAAKLRQVPNFVVGIGTLIRPVSLRIENW